MILCGIHLSPNGMLLATGSSDSSIRVWDPNSEFGDSFKLVGHDNSIRCVRFLPDSEKLVSGSSDSTIRLWDVERKESISTISDRKVNCLDLFSNRGNMMITGDNNTLQFYDFRMGRGVNTKFCHGISPTLSVKCSPDTSYVAVSGKGGICIYDSRKLSNTEVKAIQFYRQKSETITSLSIHPSGDYLLSGSLGKVISVYDVYDTSRMNPVMSIKDLEHEVQYVSFSPSGKYFCSGGNINYQSGMDNTGHAFFWKSQINSEDLSFRKMEEKDERIELEKVRLQSLVDENDTHFNEWRNTDFREYLDRGSFEDIEREELEKVRLQAEVDRRTNEEEELKDRILRKMYDSFKKNNSRISVLRPSVLGEFTHDENVVRCVCFSHDSSMLFTGSESVVKCWNLQSKGLTRTLSDIDGQVVNVVECSPNGKFVVAGTKEGWVVLWDLDSGRQYHVLYHHDYSVNCVDFSSDGLWMVSGSDHQDSNVFGVDVEDSDMKNITVWDVEKSKCLRRIHFDGNTRGIMGENILDLKFLIDDRTVIGGVSDGIKIYDIRSGKMISYLKTFAVKSVDVNTDCTLLAAARQKEVPIYDLRKNMKLVHKFEEHTDVVRSLSFHPSLNYLISGGFDGTVKLFNVEEKKMMYSLNDIGNVFSVRFSPNGKYFAAGSDDKKSHVWNFETGPKQEVEDLKTKKQLNNEEETKPEDGMIISDSDEDEGESDGEESAVDKTDYNNKESVLKALKSDDDGSRLKKVSKELRNDLDVVFAAIMKEGDSFQHAGDGIKKNRSAILKILEKGNYFSIVDIQTEDFLNFLKHIDEEIINDREFVIQCVKNSGYVLNHVSEDMKNDREVVTEAMVHNDNWFALQYASNELRSDSEFVMDLMSKSHESLSVFRFSSETLRGNKNFVLECVRKYGAYNFCHDMDDELKNDRDVMLECVNDFPEAIGYAGEDLIKNKKFLLEAVRVRGRVLEYKDEGPFEMILMAIKNDPTVFSDISEVNFEEEKFLNLISNIEVKTEKLSEKKKYEEGMKIKSIAVWNRNLNIVVSVSTDHKIRLWDVSLRSCIATIQEHSDSVNDCAIHPILSNDSDETFLTSSSDGSILKFRFLRIPPYYEFVDRIMLPGYEIHEICYSRNVNSVISRKTSDDNKNYIHSSSFDGEIDYQLMEEEQIFYGPIASNVFSGDVYISVCEEGKYLVKLFWDDEDTEIKLTMETKEKVDSICVRDERNKGDSDDGYEYVLCTSGKNLICFKVRQYTGMDMDGGPSEISYKSQTIKLEDVVPPVKICSFSISPKVVFICDDEGVMKWIRLTNTFSEDSDEEPSYELVLEKKIHNGRINSLHLIKKPNEIPKHVNWLFAMTIPDDSSFYLVNLLGKPDDKELVSDFMELKSQGKAKEALKMAKQIVKMNAEVREDRAIPQILEVLEEKGLVDESIEFLKNSIQTLQESEETKDSDVEDEDENEGEGEDVDGEDTEKDDGKMNKQIIQGLKGKLGSLQLENGLLSDAEETFSEIVDEAYLDEENEEEEIPEEIHEMAIDCLISLNKTEKATKQIKKVINMKRHRMQPSLLSRLHMKQAGCYRRLGKYKKSIRSVNNNIDVLKGQGGQPMKLNESFFVRSKLRSKMGDERGSLSDLNQVIRACENEEKKNLKEEEKMQTCSSFAEDEKAYFYRMKGMLLKKEKKYEKAIEVFRKSIEIVRKSLESYQKFRDRKTFDLTKEEFEVWAENEIECLQIHINKLMQNISEEREEKSLTEKEGEEGKKENNIVCSTDTDIKQDKIKEIRMAFISHVSDYGNEDQNLKGTKLDFDRMFGLVSEIFDYVHPPLSDKEATKEAFMKSFRRFLKKRMEFIRMYPDHKIVTFFYYSGHGYYKRHAILELQNDDEIEIEKLKFLLRSENSINIFILDCCQNYKKLTSDDEEDKPILKPMDVHSSDLKFSNNLICLSQEPGMCSIARKNDVSVYTEYVLRYLWRENFNLEYLLKNVKKDVVKYTQRNERRRGYIQNPWYQSDLFEDYIWNRTEDFKGNNEVEYLRKENLVNKVEIMELRKQMEEKNKKIERLGNQRSEVFDFLMNINMQREEEDYSKFLFHYDHGGPKMFSDVEAWWIEGEEDEKIRRKNKRIRKVKVKSEPKIPSKKFDYSKDLHVSDVIGRGGQCTVYFCKIQGDEKKNNDSKKYAYKEFKSPKELYVESMGMCNLKHPNILSCVGYCFSPKSMGLVLEYCSKGDLFQFMREASDNLEKNKVILPLKIRLRFVMEIVSSLDYLHHNVLIFHRDIKLQNILVSEKLEMKLMDFGLCRKISLTRGLLRKSGSPKYMAPEILNGMKQTEKVDVYAFGMVFYCILMISPEPFEEFEDIKLLEEKVRNQNFKPFVSVENIPIIITGKEDKYNYGVDDDDNNMSEEGKLKELVLLMERCWNFEPDQRPTFEEIKLELENGEYF